MLFSQRKGLKPIKDTFQTDNIDDDLRARLWNTLTIYYWKHIGEWLSYDTNSELLVHMLWHHYFKKPMDTINDHWESTYKVIREYFFNCKWYEVYDFVEFMGNNSQTTETNPKFKKACNITLEQEVSAYRFIDGKISQITSDEEIAEIEQAIGASNKQKPVTNHLKASLNLLSDRKNPDYRNSIKESILAVEAICNLIAQTDKTTLGQALKKIENKLELHPALKKAFDSLYGYTSDAEGIRHSLLDEPNLDFEDAKFMLVSCSAFINYLKIKASKAKIKL